LHHQKIITRRYSIVTFTALATSAQGFRSFAPIILLNRHGRKRYNNNLKRVSSSKLFSKTSMEDEEWISITANKGAIVRKGIELDSEKIDILPYGTKCKASYTTKMKRVQIYTPIKGWISQKCCGPLLKNEHAPSFSEMKNLRWIIDIGDWKPSQKEFVFLLDLIPEKNEREAVLKYTKKLDQYRALISRLLIRNCCSKALGLNNEQIHIQRTKGSKPFLTQEAKSSSKYKNNWPNFNFNVSHEGRFVILGAESYFLIGIDVAAPEYYRKSDILVPQRQQHQQNLPKFFQTMRGILSKSEWQYVKAVPNIADQAQRFRALWSCKEAFTKARGDGIAFGLGRCEFSISPSSSFSSFTAQISVDGIALEHWSFFGYNIGFDHFATIALGPPADVVDAYGQFKNSFYFPDFSPPSLDSSLRNNDHDDYNPFTFLSIRDLVPPGLLSQYDSSSTTSSNGD